MPPITDAQLQAMLTEAAEQGAKLALKEVGLHDDEAGRDIRDLRNVLDGWRSARKTVLSTVTQWVTMAFLGALAFGTYTQLTGKK
jgi:hypothetical protein